MHRATQNIHRTTQKYIEQHKKIHRITQKIHRTTHKCIEQHKNIHRRTQKIYRTTQKMHREKQKIYRATIIQEECGPCPVFAGITLAFALQLRKKHGKT
jgi:metal-dependent HD superfamily phosphatase/phosphodiesterase